MVVKWFTDILESIEKLIPSYGEVKHEELMNKAKKLIILSNQRP
jgi:hypothetical protein